MNEKSVEFFNQEDLVFSKNGLYASPRPILGVARAKKNIPVIFNAR